MLSTTTEEQEAKNSTDSAFYFGRAPPPTDLDERIAEIVNKPRGPYRNPGERMRDVMACLFAPKCTVQLSNPTAMKWHIENHQEYIDYLQYRRKAKLEGRRLYARAYQLQNLQLPAILKEIEQLKGQIEKYQSSPDTKEIDAALRDEILERRLQGKLSDSEHGSEQYNIGDVAITEKEKEFLKSLPKEEQQKKEKLGLDELTRARRLGARLQNQAF